MERLDRIDDQLGDLRERVARQESTQEATWRSVKAIRGDFRKHTDEEMEGLRKVEDDVVQLKEHHSETREDVARIRGILEERERHREKNPAIQILQWVLRFFGVGK